MINLPIKRAAGFSLVELMVAITISLLVTLVILQVHLSGMGSQRAQTDMSRLQESSRFAFDVLDRSLRKAGYKNPRALATSGTFCESSVTPRLGFLNDTATIDPAAANLTGSAVTVPNNSDTLRVRYYGDGAISTPFAADGSMLDCLGNAVASNALVEDTFFITTDTATGEPGLFCRTSNAAASGNVLLVPGVESLQILYGDDNNGDGTVNRYATGATASNPNNVRSVLISLVIRSGEASAAQRSVRVFNHFGASYAPADTAPSGDAGSVFSAAADGRVRQHFSTTVGIRNLCPI